MIESKDIERFLSKVIKSDSGCWIWIASKDKDGYGRFSFSGEDISAHRTSWLIYKGDIPEGLHVHHNCPGGDNPSCVNPNHLWLGTQADNIADKVAKGRGCSGVCEERKISGETVRRVFELRLGVRYYNNSEIARLCSISPQKVCYILRSYLRLP